MADLILTADLRVDTLAQRIPPSSGPNLSPNILSDSAEPLLGAPTSQEGPLAPWDHLMGKKGSIAEPVLVQPQGWEVMGGAGSPRAESR